jgi:macrolide-specific efflux system membrane fusion protein
MTHRKGFTFLAIVTILAIVLGTAACSGKSSTGQDNPTPTPIPLAAAPLKATYTVQRGEVISLIQFSGRISPVKLEDMFFRTDGRVRNVYVKQGDQVKKGQILADLEVLDSLQRRQAQNAFNLRRAEIRLEIAKLQLEQAQASVVEDITSTTSTKDYGILMKQYDVELAQIDLEQTRLENEDVQATIDAAQIVATMDGQVLSVDLYAGTNVAAYKTGVTIGDISQMEVVAEPSSEQLSQLVEGQAASVVASFQPGVALPGSIRQLPYSGKTTSTSDPLTHIALETDPAQAGFGYNDSVRVTITLEQKQDVIWLPIQAVRTFEGRRFVVVQDGSIQRRVDVKVGITGEDRIEIIEGLTEGQIVVSP